MFEREIRVPVTLIAAPPDDFTMATVPFVERHRKDIRAAAALVRENLCVFVRTQTSYFDRRVKPVPFTVGQEVWVYWPKPLVRQRHRKLTNE